MRNYKFWMSSSPNEFMDIAFDMCEKTQVAINNQQFDAIINDANEWQIGIDNIILLKKTIYQLQYGDYVIIDGKPYLVRFPTEDRDIYLSGKMRLCNESLKWNSFDYPCIIDKTFSLSENTTQNVTTVDGQLYAMTQYNSDTLSIKASQRFILGNHAYEVIGSDDVSNVYQGKGLIIFTLKRVELSDSDDLSTGTTTPPPSGGGWL